MSKTKIEWAEHSWNPVTGCTPVSAGCENCYAKRMAKRLQRMGTKGYENGFRVTIHPDRLNVSFGKKPKRIFVCSMSDLFHEDVPAGFIDRVFDVIKNNPQHEFLILTKRPELMGPYVRTRLGAVSSNVMLGVTAENQKMADLRIPILLSIPAARRFVSIEPMLGPVDIEACGTFARPDLVICGGESGPGARSMHPDWVRGLRDQCVEAGVPFFFKQWGEWLPTKLDCVGIRDANRAGKPTLCSVFKEPNKERKSMMDWYGCLTYMERVGKKKAGRTLDGRTWDEWPADLGVRQWPERIK